MRVLLDTNAYSALMRGHHEVADFVRQAEQIFLSAIVAGELFFGFHNGTHYQENLGRLGIFMDNPLVHLVPVTMKTADLFGRISTALRKKGTPIPTNDIWIAAHTMETGALLLSSDPHFHHVDGLTWHTLS